MFARTPRISIGFALVAVVVSVLFLDLASAVDLERKLAGIEQDDSGPSGAANRAAALHKLVLTYPRKDFVIRRSLDYLSSGENLHWSLPFKVDRSGSCLSSWPTSRLFVLDHLSQIESAWEHLDWCRTNLDSFESVSEQLLLLRDLWKMGTRSDKPVVRQRAGLLIDRLAQLPPAAKIEPGDLHVFDFVAACGDPGLTEQAVRVLASREAHHPGVRRAAFLALDRLAWKRCGLLAAAFLKFGDGEFEGNERALLISRLVPANESEKRDLEQLLPLLRDEELNLYSTAFPNANFAVINGLVSKQTKPSLEYLARRDRVALRILEHWKSEGLLGTRETFQPKLAIDRLERFLRSYEKGKKQRNLPL